jgi:hypothetical protein
MLDDGNWIKPARSHTPAADAEDRDARHAHRLQAADDRDANPRGRRRIERASARGINIQGDRRMKQHPLDLLPEAIYERSQAGLRTGRLLCVLTIIVAAVVVTATHSRLAVRSEEDRLARASSKANEAFTIEARAKQLRQELAHIERFTNLYDSIAYPLEISSIVATVINQLPSSITLDQIDLTAGVRQTRSAARSRGAEPTTGKGASGADASAPPRQLVGELSGFGVSDEHIAQLVRSLETMALFGDVSLDYSRTRVVRGVSAREFRLSFRVDLDARYVVLGEESPASDPERTAHVNH